MCSTPTRVILRKVEKAKRKHKGQKTNKAKVTSQRKFKN